MKSFTQFQRDMKRHLQLINSTQRKRLLKTLYDLASRKEELEDKRRGELSTFLFQQTSKLSSDVAAFMGGAVIPARQFSFEILKLKRQLPRAEQTVKRVSTDAAQNTRS